MKLDPPHPVMCECPECAGSPFTPSRVMDRFIAGTSDMASAADPLDAELTAAILCCSFRRSGRAHAFLLAVDHSDGATGEIQIMPEAFLPTVLADMSAHESTPPVEVHTEQLEPAALRRMIVDGLEAQELRELAGGLPMPPPNDEDGQPGYQVLSVLLRARMNLIAA